MGMEKRPVACQVYSVRDEAEKDFDATLCALAQMGYDGVEFAGFYGHSAQEISAMLLKHGLCALSSHVPFSLIEQDAFGVISYHRQIGCKYIAIPSLEEVRRPGAARFAETLSLIEWFGGLCREAGITLLYHNHAFEFVEVSGQYGLDFLFDAVSPCVLQTEIDVCWVKYAGEDPAAYLRKYAGRIPVVHLKDFVLVTGAEADLARSEKKAPRYEFRPFGHGCQDVNAVLAAAIEGGAEWFVVEQDLAVGMTPMEAARMSLDTLRGAGVK